MGIFSWLKGRPPEDKLTTWLREQIRDNARSRNAMTLLEAASALRGGCPMAFGMLLSMEIPGRDALLEETVDAIRKLIPTLPDEHCDLAFAEIERHGLAIDVAARRARLEASRRDAAARAEEFLRGELAACVGANKVIELAHACVALRGPGEMVFGMVVPAGVDREALLARGMAAIRERIPELDVITLRQLATVTRYAGLELGLDAVLAEIADELAAKRAAIREAAAGSEPRDPLLEREVAAAFDGEGDAAFMVLADFLQSKGHPRGELIALQLAGKPHADFIAEHAAILLGPLEPHRLLHDDSNREAFTWQRGFIYRAHLSINDYVAKTPDSLADILELLFAHPSARYLRSLSLGINGEDTEAPLDDAIAVIAREAPASLRSLHVGDFEYPDETEMSWYEVGNLAPLWPRLSGLQKLIIQGGSFTLGEIDLPALEHAEFRTGGLSHASAMAIANARWPKLQTLEVWLGSPEWGGETTMDDVRAILARDDLPALVNLGLVNATETDAICDELVRSPLAAQLHELDLSMGTLSDDGARVLAAAAAKFPKLKRLDVSQSYLSAAAIAELCAAFSEVDAIEQRDEDTGDRYPSVGE